MRPTRRQRNRVRFQSVAVIRTLARKLGLSRLTHYGPPRSDFAVTHKTAAHYRLTSVASNVDIAENARFKFQII